MTTILEALLRLFAFCPVNSEVIGAFSLAISAAVNRKTFKGQIVNSAEALSPEQAVELFMGDIESPGEPRVIAVGEPACKSYCNN